MSRGWYAWDSPIPSHPVPHGTMGQDGQPKSQWKIVSNTGHMVKVILVALFHFPKFQLGTKMGSRDIGKIVTEKVSFVEWLIFKDP